GPGPLSNASLRALELSVGRRVDGLLAGDYRSAFAGVGSELWQVRPYEPGDDVRRIGWNATARTGQPHVRVQLPQRVPVPAPALVIVVSDCRGPLDWRPPLLRLAGRQTVLAAEVRDPREQELADIGELRLVDPETGRQLRVDTGDAKLRSRFATAAAAERRSLAASLATAGVGHTVLS